CGGSDSYPVSQVSQGAFPVMISPATLNSWVVNGYGTDSLGYNKLIILDVDSASNYDAGHIPGAYNLDTETDLQTTRSNGVAFTVSQVPTKAMMDALIQRTGIDARTVVALVGNGTMMNVGRAYFNFRYWGFPRERLRVLNGTKNATYRDSAGYTLSTTSTPLPTPSTYSVANLTPNAFETRASMEDMIAYASDNDPFTVIIDARSADEYRGVGRKTSTATSGTYVAFEGHVRTAENQEYVELHEGGNRANPLLSKNELITAMAAINMNEDSTGISYCRTSWRAAIQFLALDAVLGWKAKIYDGAWIQWGQMATNDPVRDGSLDPASPWRTDNADLTESLTYNRQIVGPIVGANSFAANANLINETDKAVCGGTGIQPSNRAVDVMLDPTTLLAWVNAGVPDDPADGPGDNPYPADYTNFVMLHVDSQADYDAGHIPGAFHLDTGTFPDGDLSATRNNGIADTISQVPDRAQMDALIQRSGIGADTIIVFYTNNNSSGSSMMSLGRAYFNFRYWGFPRERLRVMDGTTNHWLAAGGTALSTTATPDVASAYSVCNLRQDIPLPGDTLAPPDKVRASFEEMYNVAGDDDLTTVIADARSADEYNGLIGKTSVGGGKYVAFEGHARTALHQEWNTLITDGDGIGWKLLPDTDLITAMTAIGADDTTTVYSYCRTSWRAAVNFLALDAVLGWPAKIYDGAWIEWGQMATNDPASDGSLDPTSPWRTDNDLTESLSYNKGLGLVLPEAGASSFAPHANLINVEDAGTAATGGGTSGGGGSSQPEAPGYN
ncbi:MAG: selenite/tellurite reduction operon rhodanese-like protein ExtH, partial [Desulfobulbales bacterium]